MVYLTVCSICKESTLNEDHAECRIAKLKDLLYQIQEAIKNGGQLPQNLKKLILSGRYPTLDEFLKAKRKQEQELFDEKMRQELKQNWLAEKGREFEKKNPPKRVPKF